MKYIVILNSLSEISPAVVESPLFYDNTVPGAFYGAAGTVLAQTLSETFDITGEYVLHNSAATCDFQQCGILTSVASDKLVLPPFKLRNYKWCSVSSLTLIK